MKMTTEATREGLTGRNDELERLHAELSTKHGELALRAAEGDTGATADMADTVAAMRQARTEQEAIRAALLALDKREVREFAASQEDDIRATFAKLEPALAVLRQERDEFLALAAELQQKLKRYVAAGEAAAAIVNACDADGQRHSPAVDIGASDTSERVFKRILSGHDVADLEVGDFSTTLDAARRYANRMIVRVRRDAQERIAEVPRAEAA